MTKAPLLSLLAVLAGCDEATGRPETDGTPPGPDLLFSEAGLLGDGAIRSDGGGPVAVFRRSLNLGNALEAPREGEWGVTLQAEYFPIIRAAGFDAVRIPVRWSAHAAAAAPYAIDPVFMDRVSWAIDESLKAGLGVVVNIHHYEELATEPAAHRARFLALWQQIAERLKDRPPTVFFELLNEPNNKLDATLWNGFVKDGIALVRKSNPTRKLVVGGVDWNGIASLSKLVIPASDPNLVLSFHYYNPFQFTHQGAGWVEGSNAWLGTAWSGSATEQAAVRKELDAAVAAAKALGGRELYLGEFGAYSKADMASRARWTAFLAREAEQRKIGWAYWEFCSGFGAYDPQAKAWRPELLKALIP